MPAWEFTYVELWLGEDRTVEDVLAAEERIAQLGADGWNPVGQVGFTFHARGTDPSMTTTIQQLMFKRLKA
ncbi:hypothetical protein [Patulibacter minatonensis]|uniref:hypothetical protein n=1 Tax=Patulibacter minatonensis TaxID=298163 RepID=UPI00047ED6B4|nr:hypothetical protein [Patulibacter minatonensis]